MLLLVFPTFLTPKRSTILRRSVKKRKILGFEGRAGHPQLVDSPVPPAPERPQHRRQFDGELTALLGQQLDPFLKLRPLILPEFPFPEERLDERFTALVFPVPVKLPSISQSRLPRHMICHI
ncbi:MAG: hypothetical protein GXP48_08260 [Acidobacteria bacterium]|nr:hypothetical protein [Acidobacteriota bacterium]